MSQTPFPYTRMFTKPDALDRLDLRFRWGGYGIRVLRCHLTVFPPGHVISFHKHSEFEFHFIPKGKGKVIIEEQPFDVQEGCFYVTGPDIMHYQESDSTDPMHELCLHCDIIKLSSRRNDSEVFGEDLERIEAEQCMDILRSFPLKPFRDSCNAMGSFLEAYRTWQEQPIGFYTLMKQAIIQILLRTARVLSQKNDVSSIPVRNMNGHRFEMACQYIQDNESLPISLEHVAERLKISPRQLQRIFRTEGNMTFRDYVEHVRLSAVCSDLVETVRPVEDIALKHGYATPNYLYPVFKDKFGMTPTEFRRMHANN